MLLIGFTDDVCPFGVGLLVNSLEMGLFGGQSSLELGLGLGLLLFHFFCFGLSDLSDILYNLGPVLGFALGQLGSFGLVQQTLDASLDLVQQRKECGCLLSLLG